MARTRGIAFGRDRNEFDPGTGEGERCRSYSGYREKDLLWCSDRNGISRNFPAGIGDDS